MHGLGGRSLGALLLVLVACGDDGSSTGSGEAGSADDTTGGEAGEGTTTAPEGTGPADTSDDDPSTMGVTTQPEPVCGNGILESIEECDDGNMVDGDGCDSDCTLNLDTSQWQTTHAGDAMIRDGGHGIAVDSQGNIVVGGYEIDVVGDPNMWVAKFDPAGNQLWAMSLDPSGGMDDRVYGVAIDPDDNILLVGDSDTAPVSSDIWVAKLDPDGAELWSTAFDGPDAGDDGGRGVASDAAGNVVVTGFVRVTNNDFDIFVAKLSPGGATQWTDEVPGPDTLDDRGQAVGVDSQGNVVVGGFVSYGGFNRNVWLRKYDPDGAELWTEEWDSPTMADDAGFGLTVAPDDTIAVAGMTPVIATNQDVWLGRWDPDGTILWYKQFGGQAYINDV
ncbi:MAG: DUF4215 domain-containing protein, partial [Myxococcales bacterium]|nr:DUF4215 domain-containing protein [Myxococcales bacterium]